MTKINEIKVPDDIHLNINETYDFIDRYLPRQYARQVLNLLPEGSAVDLSYIRRVKKFRIKNARIMIALYRVAQWYKMQEN